MAWTYRGIVRYSPPPILVIGKEISKTPALLPEGTRVLGLGVEVAGLSRMLSQSMSFQHKKWMSLAISTVCHSE